MTWLASEGCVFAILFRVVVIVRFEIGWKRLRLESREKVPSDIVGNEIAI